MECPCVLSISFEFQPSQVKRWNCWNGGWDPKVRTGPKPVAAVFQVVQVMIRLRNRPPNSPPNKLNDLKLKPAALKPNGVQFSHIKTTAYACFCWEKSSC